MLSRFRRPACHLTACAGLALTFCTASTLFAQSSGFGSPYQFRDATSVGFVPTAYPYGWGAYPYRTTRVAPAGEFGGYLYRSPSDYTDFRGPEYAPIANEDVGMAVADASGRVAFENVPIWSDEWAARIIRNREAAGLAVNSLASAHPAPRGNQAPAAFRPLLRGNAAQPAAPVAPMRPIQAPRPESELSPRPAPISPQARVTPRPTSVPKATELRPDHPHASAASRGTMVLTAPGATSDADESEAVPAPSNTKLRATNDIDRPHEAPDARPATQDTVAATEPVQNERKAIVESSATNKDTLTLNATTTQPRNVAPPKTEPVVAKAPTNLTPQLTREDLNRATAAGIAIGRGDKAFEQGEYAQARDEYRQAIDVAGDAPGIRIAMGLSDFALGDFAGAAHAIRQGVAQSPELAVSDFRLQDVYGHPDDSNLHRHKLDEFVTQNPEDANALFLLGFVQYFSDQIEAARTTFGAYRSIVPHDELADPFIEQVLHGTAAAAD